MLVADSVVFVTRCVGIPAGTHRIHPRLPYWRDAGSFPEPPTRSHMAARHTTETQVRREIEAAFCGQDGRGR
jgi:hypothetical protein